MIRKGSLVRFVGESKVIKPGKLLQVHDVKDGSVVVWFLAQTGKYIKKALKTGDVELVVE